MFKKIVSLVLSISLVITQPIFAQGLSQLNLAQYLGQMHPLAADIFRPTQLRYFSYDNLNNSYRILLDKGDLKDIKDNQLKEEAKELMDYFLVGLALPNDTFWVNLRPDSPESIIDPELEKTELGRILLEADLQLKKDTANFTSPKTPEGKQYWDKLYKKAGELFGTENITIPTITRPWIVPGEIIVRESQSSAYIYKATLKVMIEEDYLSRGRSRTAPTMRTAPTPDQYNFTDPRLKELNEYSTQIIRETIIPKLTKEVNSSKRYAKLRQVYYSLVLSRWFKARFRSQSTEYRVQSTEKANNYLSLIDSGNLTNLTAKEPYDRLICFKEYQKSFAQGEYNLKEPVYTPYGQSIRAYMSGGFIFTAEYMNFSGLEINAETASNPAEEQLLALPGENTVILDKNFEIVNPEQPLALAASAVTPEALRNAGTMPVNDFILINITEKSRRGFTTKENLESTLEACKRYMLEFPGKYIEAAKIRISKKEVKEITETLFLYFNPRFTARTENIAVATRYLSGIMESKFKEDGIAQDFEKLGEEIDNIVKLLNKSEKQPEAVIPDSTASATVEVDEGDIINADVLENITGIKRIFKLFSDDGKELIKRYPDSNELYEETEKKLKTYWETEETYDIQKAAEAALEFYAAIQSKGLKVEPEMEKKIKMLQDTGAIINDVVEKIRSLIEKDIVKLGEIVNTGVVPEDLNRFSRELNLKNSKATVNYILFLLSDRFKPYRDDNLESFIEDSTMKYFLIKTELEIFDFPGSGSPLTAERYIVNDQAKEKIENIKYALMMFPFEAPKFIARIRNPESKRELQDLYQEINERIIIAKEANDIIGVSEALREFYAAVAGSQFQESSVMSKVSEKLAELAESDELKSIIDVVVEKVKNLMELDITAFEVVMLNDEDVDFTDIESIIEELSLNNLKSAALMMKKLFETHQPRGYSQYGKKWASIIFELKIFDLPASSSALTINSLAILKHINISKIAQSPESVLYRKLIAFYESMRAMPKFTKLSAEESVLENFISKENAFYNAFEYILKDEKVLNKYNEINIEAYNALYRNDEQARTMLKKFKDFIDEYTLSRQKTAVVNIDNKEFKQDFIGQVIIKIETEERTEGKTYNRVREYKIIPGDYRSHGWNYFSKQAIMTENDWESDSIHNHELGKDLVGNEFGDLAYSSGRDKVKLEDDQDRIGYTTGMNKMFSGIADSERYKDTVRYVLRVDYAEKGIFRLTVNHNSKSNITIKYTPASSSLIVKQEQLDNPSGFAKGGIDFTDRAMKIGLERIGSFADLKLVLPEVDNVTALDLDNEFKQIQAMASSGIRPADSRILEFAAACYYRGEFSRRLGEITSCLQQAHFLDERLGKESSQALRLATMLPEVLYSHSLN